MANAVSQRLAHHPHHRLLPAPAERPWIFDGEPHVQPRAPGLGGEAVEVGPSRRRSERPVAAAQHSDHGAQGSVRVQPGIPHGLQRGAVV